MYTSIAERLASRLGQKMAKKTPFRGDFVVADYRVLDEDGKSAKVLIQYDPEAYGVPSKKDVIATMTHLYQTKDDGRPRLVVDADTIKSHPQLCAISCVVNIPSLRRPYSDVKRFKMKTVVANTVFLGENMSDTWAVAKSDNNAIYIERVEKDDIEKILNERSKANAFRTYSGRSNITLARVENQKGTDIYANGDLVKCVHGGKVETGEILGLSDTGAHLRLKNGSQVTVNSSSLLGLVQAAEDMKTFNAEALKEYYRKAYGYSEEDLNKLVQYVG
jgi:hypothetical protein